MNTLILVRSDPRTSDRPAEAFRVAVGLAAGPLHVVVALLGDGAAALAEETYLLQDGDTLESHRNLFAREGTVIAESTSLPDPEETAEVRYTAVPAAEIAMRLAEAERVLVF